MEKSQLNYKHEYDFLSEQYDLLKEEYSNVIAFLKRNNLLDRYIDEKKKSGVVPQ